MVQKKKKTWTRNFVSGYPQALISQCVALLHAVFLSEMTIRGAKKYTATIISDHSADKHEAETISELHWPPLH